jgi:hypothetical protein
MASSLLRFLYRTQRRTTIGSTALAKWSACRWDLCLTTKLTNNHAPAGFEPAIPARERPQTHALRWVHTCNVTAYRNTVSWQCGWDSWPRNVSKVGYAVTLRSCSVCCRYLVVTSKGWYGYGLSRSGRPMWRVTTVRSSRLDSWCFWLP